MIRLSSAAASQSVVLKVIVTSLQALQEMMSETDAADAGAETERDNPDDVTRDGDDDNDDGEV